MVGGQKASPSPFVKKDQGIANQPLMSHRVIPESEKMVEFGESKKFQEKGGRNSKEVRKKGKGTLKSSAYRKEKKKWANFARGFASEEEIRGMERSRKHSAEDGSEDKISEHIRNEAIKTWNVGRNLGIQNIVPEEMVINKLMEAERNEDVTKESGMEKDNVVFK